MEDMTGLMAELYVCIGQIEIEGERKHRIEAARTALGPGLGVRLALYQVQQCVESYCVSNTGMCMYTQVIQLFD